MTPELAELRQALEALPYRGGRRRYPEALKARVAAYDRARRAEGALSREVAGEPGLSSMIGISRQVRVFVYTRPTDMRLGFDGLYARVRNELGANPLSGDIFLFIGKDRRKAKAILWDGTGLLLYYKRLEKGLFAPLFHRESPSVQMTLSELQLFFEGSIHVGRLRLSPDEFNPVLIA